MHPVMILTIGIVGAAALVRWCVREVVRVNSDLDTVRAQASVEPFDRELDDWRGHFTGGLRGNYQLVITNTKLRRTRDLYNSIKPGF